jgi:hypothetical protein
MSEDLMWAVPTYSFAGKNYLLEKSGEGIIGKIDMIDDKFEHSKQFSKISSQIMISRG